jgi:mRNA-degrading endonuclease RelE of RelBE toxin-antitoxin system
MNFDVVTTDRFDKQLKKLLKKYFSLKKDYEDLIDSLEEDPTQGAALGRDCYKVRLAISSKGKGKSGGARVITCVKVVGETVYLLSIYDKAEQDTVKNNELDTLLDEAGLG